MPIYEYLCSECAHRFEKKQSFSASTLDECPVCHQPAHRVISRTSFILKGSGWYATDHPSHGRGRSSHSHQSDSSGSDSPAPSAPETAKPDGGDSHKAA